MGELSADFKGLSRSFLGNGIEDARRCEVEGRFVTQWEVLAHWRLRGDRHSLDIAGGTCRKTSLGCTRPKAQVEELPQKE